MAGGERIADRPDAGLLASAESLLEAMPDGVVLSDAQGRILFVNAELERMTGYSRDELVGHGIEMLVPDEARAQHERNRRGYVEHPRTRPMGLALDIRARRKDGSVFPVHISLSVVGTDEHAVVVSAVRDATQRTHMQDDARKQALSADRERIGRELADGVVHSLFSIGMSLQSALTYVRDNQAAEARIGETVEQLDVVIRNLRSYVFGSQLSGDVDITRG